MLTDEESLPGVAQAGCLGQGSTIVELDGAFYLLECG